MRIFLFSGRFLAPFFIVWVFHLGFILWEAWHTWKQELTKKGLPSSLRNEFLLNQVASPVLLLTFLIAFLTAMVFYSHYRVRKEKHIPTKLFSVFNLTTVVLIAFIAFLHTSFREPAINARGQELLSKIVYGDYTDTVPGNSKTAYRKAPRMMTIIELFRAKDSLKATYNINEKYNFPYLNNSQRELDRIRYEIGRKFSLPLNIIVFYFIGIFLGASLYRIHVIVPFLISYLVLFTLWYYVQQVIERLYHRQIIGVFFVAGGTAILFALLGVAWFFVLRKYRMFKKKNDDPTSDESIDFENKEVG